MLTLIIGCGIGFVIGAAVLVGNQGGLDRALRDVAGQRRELHEDRAALDELAAELVAERLRLEDWEARLVLATERARTKDGNAGVSL